MQKMFTLPELTEAVQVASFLEQATQQFEGAKSTQFHRLRAQRLIGAWNDVIAAQEKLGFEFLQTNAIGNAPCAVRAAKAFIAAN
jgi:hypothetical protein